LRRRGIPGSGQANGHVEIMGSLNAGDILLTDGLIARFGGDKVRVRLSGAKAWLTVKGQRAGITREEFEFEILPAEADLMLQSLCGDQIIRKTRHCIPYAGRI
jgi:adenylate cyclase